ncbi:MAG: NlpC/P60 family protein [Cypionkella sp.]
MTRQTSHWAEGYIGMPAADCWAFVRDVWEGHWGLVVPVLPYEPGNARSVRRSLDRAADHGWIAVTCPQEGDAVLMAQGQRPSHVGLWIEPDDVGGVLHWTEAHATVWTVPAQLGSFGYRILGFWRHPALDPSFKAGIVA